MKGKVLIPTPGELYAPTTDGVVVSADSVKDYPHNKTQEAVNNEFYSYKDSFEESLEEARHLNEVTIEAINNLQPEDEHDFWGNIHIAIHENAIKSIADQLNAKFTYYGLTTKYTGGYKFRVVTEEEMASITPDANTLYFQIEEED